MSLAPRAEPSASVSRRRSMMSRESSQSAATATPIGPEATMTSIAVAVAAREIAVVSVGSASESKVSEVTASGLATFATGWALLVNPRSWGRIATSSSTVRPAVERGMTTVVIIGALNCFVIAGQDPGSMKAAPMTTRVFVPPKGV